MFKTSINLWSRHQILVYKKLCRLICCRMYLLCQGCLVSSELMFECQSRDCQRQLHGSPKEALLYIVLFAVFFKYVLLFRCVLMLLKVPVIVMSVRRFISLAVHMYQLCSHFMEMCEF